MSRKNNPGHPDGHNRNSLAGFLGALACLVLGFPATVYAAAAAATGQAVTVPLRTGTLTLDGIFYETAAGRTAVTNVSGRMPDGRTVAVTVKPDGSNRYQVRFSATPAAGITRWGFAISSAPDEYYTGLMERVIDGAQAASWRPGITEAMNLRGQKVDMIVKPTTSVYAPYFMSSRGYAVLAQSEWPGVYDFANANKERVGIAFEGPTLAVRVYVGAPADLVRMHALDSGPPVLPPKWMYRPWRWRDEHLQLATYYDGTPVTGGFNSQVMEDIFMMRAFGIPTGVYWVDRPWGPGPLGYDDFEVDDGRLPNFTTMVKWLDSQSIKTMLWIGPFFQGKMKQEGLEKGYTLAGQPPTTNPNANNYPMVDLTNPAAKAYWQAGVEKLLKMGVVGFKLDRGEENIPDDGPFKRFDGKSIRENRNTYVALYAQAVAEVARKHRGSDFVAMPRGAYEGSAASAVFWGGDIGGTPEGLRASIIAVQRCAVMGYPNWGSDTGGYNQQTMDSDMYARWLGFSAFTPIMEIGPTQNVGFWNLPAPHAPSYDAPVIATWRLYARLHDRLVDYSYAQGVSAARTGLPIVQPLFLLEPGTQAAWDNWWTYQYGPDILVSPIWEKGRREQQVYLPKGKRWRDVWSGKVYDGGQTITIKAELHQQPLFVRNGAAVARVIGDLNKEWSESVAIAAKHPDLAAMDTELKQKFPSLKLSVQPPYPAPSNAAESFANPGGIPGRGPAPMPAPRGQ